MVSNVFPNKEGGVSKIKVKVRMNINGLFTVTQASLVEKVSVNQSAVLRMRFFARFIAFFPLFIFLQVYSLSLSNFLFIKSRKSIFQKSSFKKQMYI